MRHKLIEKALVWILRLFGTVLNCHVGRVLVLDANDIAVRMQRILYLAVFVHWVLARVSTNLHLLHLLCLFQLLELLLSQHLLDVELISYVSVQIIGNVPHFLYLPV